MAFNEFEAVIGLEVHAQLLTKSKIFCYCENSFFANANSNLCPVCAGHPGALPVLNRGVVEMAIKAGLATRCQIQPLSVFARKNYFYPDLPKGYQISQYDRPLCTDGSLELTDGTSIGIQRIHLEEDAGKSVHLSGVSLVNLNRASIPLIEIVSKPELKTPEQAGEYLRQLHAILTTIGVNDGNLQEGSFRCDANVSVRPAGATTLGTRVEIKNLNSFRFVEKSIHYEIGRQVQTIRSGANVVQETRSFDSGKNITVSMRTKEEAQDYRYFPDPDLLPLRVELSWVERVRKVLPELPQDKTRRFISQFLLPQADASTLVRFHTLARIFEEVVALGLEPRIVANWVLGELKRHLKSNESEDEDSHFELPAHFTVAEFSKILMLVNSGCLSLSAAKQVFDQYYKEGGNAESIVEALGLAQVSDISQINKQIEEVLLAHPQVVSDYLSGKEKLFGFLVGATMKKMGGRANPSILNDLLKKRLSR